MPRIEYVAKRFGAASKALIDKANTIIAEYQAQGFEMTLRQLYYQLVSRDLLPNKQKEYKRLGSIINDARLAGLVDWSAIVDRTRHVRQNSHWSGPGEIVAACAKQFQIDKWADQDDYVEVFIEKDALLGVIEPSCRSLDVAYFSCRGYTSQTEAWAAAQRYAAMLRDGRNVTVLHLSDHDPSGIDMTADLQNRMDIFCQGDDNGRVEVKRIALTMDQVDKYKPPPNPAKETDSRFESYREKFGDESWELDALEPQVLAQLIADHVHELRDENKWDAQLEREEAMKATLEKAARKMKKEKP